MDNAKTIKREKSIYSSAGFTLVELLVVLSIIGMIAALATPQVIGYLGSARASTTSTQIRSLESALELFYLDTGKYPDHDEGLEALKQMPEGVMGWRGPYVKGRDALKDAWGNPLVYKLEENGRKAVIISLGRDGREGGEDLDADLKGSYD